jgi:xanthine dehydrogenase accessory factor
MTTADLLLRAQHLRTERTPFVLATVVRAQRPTSAKAGDAALVLPDGTLDGFVGGTCAESTVRAQGLRLLATGRSTLLRILPEPSPDDTEADGVVTVANPCLSGGALEIFLEAMLPPALVRVFGDAPIARALVRVTEAAGYEVTASTDPDAPVPADASAVVVASHGRDEEPVLTAAVRAGVPYVALVASRRRAAAVLSGLDLTEEERSRVRAPAGLDIGARTPAEVAVSIVADIVASRPRPPSTPAPAGPVATSTVDPVCGMDVAVSPAAPHLHHAGRDWYFCGTGCRQAFADSPERYGA